jgi:type I restriction enzyme S subunit
LSAEELPQGWSEASLRDLVMPVASIDPARAGIDEFTYVDIGSIDSASGTVSTPSRLTAAQAPSRARQSVREGDVLFSTVRPYLRAIARMPASNNAVASTGFCVLRPGPEIDARLLFHWVRSDAFVEQVLPYQRGSSYPAVRDDDVLGCSVRVPPIGEQRRIADALDELFSGLGEAVAELEAARQKLTQYRQSLLKSAVEGALTADWRARNPPRETGAELLARILRERRSRWEARQLERFKAQGKTPPKDWQRKYVEPAAPDTSSLTPLPCGWKYASIGQCFHVAVGATPSRKAGEFWGGDVPWVSSGEIRFNRISKTRESITAEGLAHSSTQINPVGSVVLGMIGEGKTRGQVAILGISAANNQNCAALWVPETDVPPEFIYAWLWSRYDETRRGSSGNNQPALNKSLVEAMPTPLAPVPEMREIVERLQVQLDGIALQERELESLLRLATAQRQNILRAAFAGQLVAQDPADEPASVLLARIRAERDDAAAKPTARRGRKAKVAA